MGTGDPGRSPTEPAARPAGPSSSFWQRWKRWILLFLVLSLCCCCGCPSLFLVPLWNGGRQIARLQAELEPGMSVERVLEAVDDVELTRLGVTNIFGFPMESDAEGSEERTSSAPCHTEGLFWSYDRSEPAWRGSAKKRAEAAQRIAGCREIRFSAVILMSRAAFPVVLESGRVKKVGPVEGRH